jgi:hypothetical protein
MKKLVMLLFLALFSTTCIIAQRGVSFAGGVGFLSGESLNGFGYHISTFLPIIRSSRLMHELKADVSLNSIPPDSYDLPANDPNASYNNLKITCIEANYRLGSEPGSGRGYWQFGLGINLNFVNGGVKSYEEVFSNNSWNYIYEPYENIIGLGFGLNFGFGFYIFPKAAIYAELAGQQIYGEANMEWGGVKLGLRIFPWRI